MFIDFLDGDVDLTQYPNGHPALMEGPPLLLHMMVSSMSALGMLFLACSLRAQTRQLQRAPRRAPVVHARPVLQVYGVLPQGELPAAEDDDEGEEHSVELGSVARYGEVEDAASATIVMVPTDFSPSTTLRVTEMPVTQDVAVGERVGLPVDGPDVPDGDDAPPPEAPNASSSVVANALTMGIPSDLHDIRNAVLRRMA